MTVPVTIRIQEADFDLAAETAAMTKGRTDIGALVPGRYADMVAVKADPLADISVLEKIDHVMKGGALIR